MTPAMVQEPTTVEKLRALPWSVASNATLSVYLQLTFFGSVFVLFLNTLGLSTSQIGFLLSLLPFAGLLALVLARPVARFGYKRTWLTFFGIRTFITAFLLLTPWVVSTFGAQAAMAFIAVVTLAFALVRTVGVTAGFPWIQEYVPNSVRGKYTAVNNIFSTVFGFFAVTSASYVLAHTTGITGYMLLIAVGVIFGFISVALAFPIPGGAPQKEAAGEQPAQGRSREVLRDARFVRYLVGVGLFTLATVPLGSFLPLYMSEQVGLTDSQTVLLTTGVMAGSLLASYFWGWAADRYGGRPVTLYGLAIRAVLPILWLLMPRDTAASLPVAMGIAVLQGAADVGWAVGATRLLYVSIVPSALRADYLAMYWAWLGLTGGLSQLIGGRLLDATRGLSGLFANVTLDPFLPLFALGTILPLIAIQVMRHISDDSKMGMGGFAGIFLRGNPFLALEAVVRFHLSKDEESAVRTTERLGSARSRLTVEELLDALQDPRFSVRFEAIVSIARVGPDQRLVAALAEVMNGPEPALSTLAAWALGRTGHADAREPLHLGLNSRYRSVQAHSSRSLGVLGDREIIPLLLERLKSEADPGLQLAYASTLGQLQVAEATDRVMALLVDAQNPSSQAELALAVARIVGDEAYFIHLMRQTRREPGTALAQAMISLRKRVEQMGWVDEAFLGRFDDCAMTLARNQLDDGVACLGEAVEALTALLPIEPHREILVQCAQGMALHGAGRMEFVVLALHTLHAV